MKTFKSIKHLNDPQQESSHWNWFQKKTSNGNSNCFIIGSTKFNAITSKSSARIAIWGNNNLQNSVESLTQDTEHQYFTFCLIMIKTSETRPSASDNRCKLYPPEGKLNKANQPHHLTLLIYLPVKFEFDWTNRFRVGDRKRKF